MTAVRADCLTLGAIRLSPGGEWTPGSAGLALVFGRGGRGVWESHSSGVPFQAGDVLVMSDEPAGTLRALKPGALNLEHFSVRSEQLIPLLRCEEICLLQAALAGFKLPRHYAAATALARECHRLLDQSRALPGLQHRSHLLGIAAAVLSDELDGVRGRRCGFFRKEDHLARVLKELTVEEILSLSVDELASRFSCSRRHLNRLFHEHFGVSVIALRMEMRLLKAVSLLRDPALKVITVAEQSGFNHLGLFNTCFKRRFGVSPGAWRRRAPAPRPAPRHPREQDARCWMRAAGLCPWASAAACARPFRP